MPKITARYTKVNQYGQPQFICNSERDVESSSFEILAKIADQIDIDFKQSFNPVYCNTMNGYCKIVCQQSDYKFERNGLYNLDFVIKKKENLKIPTKPFLNVYITSSKLIKKPNNGKTLEFDF